MHRSNKEHTNTWKHTRTYTWRIYQLWHSCFITDQGFLRRFRDPIRVSSSWRWYLLQHIVCCSYITLLFWGAPGCSPVSTPLNPPLLVTFFRSPGNCNPLSLPLWQSDCLYSSLFFEHYNRILLCDRVLGRYSVYLRACTYHNTFVLDLALDQGWTQCPILDVVLYQVLRVNEQ